jgi:excisionase family DNA binding protein
VDEERKRPEGAPLTLGEAAVYLGLSSAFLYKLTSQGKIPHYKPANGKLYFKLEDLDGYLYRNRRAADYELADKADAILNRGRV